MDDNPYMYSAPAAESGPEKSWADKILPVAVGAHFGRLALAGGGRMALRGALGAGRLALGAAASPWLTGATVAMDPTPANEGETPIYIKDAKGNLVLNPNHPALAGSPTSAPAPAKFSGQAGPPPVAPVTPSTPAPDPVTSGMGAGLTGGFLAPPAQPEKPQALGPALRKIMSAAHTFGMGSTPAAQFPTAPADDGSGSTDGSGSAPAPAAPTGPAGGMSPSMIPTPQVHSPTDPWSGSNQSPFGFVNSPAYMGQGSDVTSGPDLIKKFMSYLGQQGPTGV